MSRRRTRWRPLAKLIRKWRRFGGDALAFWRAVLWLQLRTLLRRRGKKLRRSQKILRRVGRVRPIRIANARAKALEVGCARCDAWPYRPCRNAKGTMVTVHMIRHVHADRRANIWTK